MEEQVVEEVKVPLGLKNGGSHGNGVSLMVGGSRLSGVFVGSDRF